MKDALYYSFERSGNVIGYSQPFDRKLLNKLDQQKTRDYAILQFCNKFNLDPFDVTVELETMKAERPDIKIIFDFKYNGGEE